MPLEVIEIDVYCGKAKVLYGVSLQVNEGEIVALLGGNGAGKSTTLLTIAGIVSARKGMITYQGKSLHQEAPASIVKCGIALCPEGRELFSDMTVEGNLRLGAFLIKENDGIALS